MRSTINFTSWTVSKYAISGSYPASTRVSYPFLISSTSQPQKTVCSPNKSVSTSSLNVVSIIPDLPPPTAEA